MTCRERTDMRINTKSNWLWTKMGLVCDCLIRGNKSREGLCLWTWPDDEVEVSRWWEEDPRWVGRAWPLNIYRRILCPSVSETDGPDLQNGEKRKRVMNFTWNRNEMESAERVTSPEGEWQSSHRPLNTLVLVEDLPLSSFAQFHIMFYHWTFTLIHI